MADNRIVVVIRPGWARVLQFFDEIGLFADNQVINLSYDVGAVVDRSIFHSDRNRKAVADQGNGRCLLVGKAKCKGLIAVLRTGHIKALSDHIFFVGTVDIGKIKVLSVYISGSVAHSVKAVVHDSGGIIVRINGH